MKSPSPVKVKAVKKRKCDAKGSGQKKSVTRAVFTKLQQDALEERFRRQSFLSREERRDLAEALKLTDRQVMIWFQNRRGRLKKRGPQDKAYHPSKLQEINIRRPYPFLCGVLSGGYHQYSIEGKTPQFSMYPREVQTHIKKVMPHLPEQGQVRVNEITAVAPGETIGIRSGSEQSLSPPLTLEDVSASPESNIEPYNIPTPNVNMLHEEGQSNNTGNMESFTYNTQPNTQVHSMQDGYSPSFDVYGLYQSSSGFNSQHDVRDYQSLAQGIEVQQPMAFSMIPAHSTDGSPTHQYNYTNSCSRQYSNACYINKNVQAHCGNQTSEDLPGGNCSLESTRTHGREDPRAQLHNATPESRLSHPPFSCQQQKQTFQQSLSHNSYSSIDSSVHGSLAVSQVSEVHKEPWNAYGQAYPTEWLQHCTQPGYNHYYNALVNHGNAGQSNIPCFN